MKRKSNTFVNHTGFYALLVTFLFFVLPNLTFAPDNSPSLQVSLAKYEPYPVSPGKYVDVWLKVENTGYGDARNATLIIESSFPFVQLEGYDYVWNIGELKPSQSAVKKFRFMVDRNAAAGTNYLKVKFSSDPSTGIWVTKELSLEVKEYQVFLKISSVSFSSALAPGSRVNMTLTIENNANLYLKNIAVSLSAQSSDLFKYAVEGSNTRIIERLDPQEKKEVVFTLLIDGSSKTGVYSIPLTLEYYDENNNLYTRTESIGVAVNQKPELEVYLDSSEEYFIKGKLNRARITVVNKGTSDARFVTVSVEENDGYKLLSSSSSYLGEIESDDQASITVEMYIEQDAPSKLQIPVVVNYKDVLGNQYSEKFTKEITVFSVDELERYGAYTSRARTYLYLALLILVLYVLKKRRKLLSKILSKR